MHLYFTPYNHSIKKVNNKDYIFCVIRKKWLQLTPEEWVRQNILHYLIEQGYPKTMLAVEKKIIVQQELAKRFDIVVYKHAKPWMLIECKETNVSINSQVLQQITAYNSRLQCPYILLTNGNQHLLWQLIPNVVALNTLPLY